jgi:hypothetical protein
MATYLNRAAMTVSGTPGTGDITLGGAATGYDTFASAGAVSGQKMNYVAEDGTLWEYGEATYSSTGPSLTGRTVTRSSSGTSTVSLTSAAIIYSSVMATDIDYCFCVANTP